MAIKKHTLEDGQVGFGWGVAGSVFVGPGASLRVTAVGRAVELQKSEGYSEEKLSQQEIEFLIADTPIENVKKGLAQLDFMALYEEDAVEEVTSLVDQLTASPAGEPFIIKKTQDDKQIFWAEVYVPLFLDSDGELMFAEEIEKMAHKFLQKQITQSVDRQHDHDTSRDAYVVESFIARDDDSIFIPGSWVVAVKIDDYDLWQDVKTGKINGVSMQAAVTMREEMVEIDLPDEIVGKTDVSLDGPSHTHKFHVRFADDGRFLGGETDFVDGHRHKIDHGTITNPPEGKNDGHQHRYSFTDVVLANRLGD